ncbi:hypothetical protein [Desulfosporosinus nitroreducens]|uniref:hypothetical protein n=1 Tax=Desulfosporosinus nitroreducens TaxID=2018668 RepID=UPI00207C1EF8|nr:hypothetical protein [Desulfosporosinus nitroreducens]MCO1604307.1 hypothetical protein [Desulfosporosinus nitroreducens]
METTHRWKRCIGLYESTSERCSDEDFAIPFGLALIPFTIWGIFEFFKGNKDYFGLVILIISPALVYFGTASKLGDVQIQIEKENKRLESMTSRERLMRNILIYGFLIAVMFLCALLPMIIL